MIDRAGTQLLITHSCSVLDLGWWRQERCPGEQDGRKESIMTCFGGPVHRNDRATASPASDGTGPDAGGDHCPAPGAGGTE